jgi:hypothetical protein
MKKFFAILLTSVIALGAMAQSPVYRVGDKYMMDGKKMTKKEYRGYLQNTCPEAFELFNNGYKLSVAGWSCFGSGLVINSVGSALLRSYLRGDRHEESLYHIGSSLASLGSGLTIAGIVCVSVGYTRMHKSVNLYNIEKAHRPDLRWVFGMNNAGGMSVAMQF